MKKAIACIVLVFGITGAFAQDLTSKKGEPILPEAGDWGLGIDANPFIDFIGNIGKSANAAPSFSFLGAQTITGRYFKDARTVFRGSFRIGINSNAQRTKVKDRSVAATSVTYPTANPMVENAYKRSNSALGLAVGIELRRGKTRLQGYYGGETGIYVASSKDRFTYGNSLNPVPTGTNEAVDVTTDDSFDGTGNLGSVPSNGVNNDLGRITERKNGIQFSFGLRGFVGVEYFFFPKISLGGELGWGLGFTVTGKSKTTWESAGDVAGTKLVGTTTVEGAKQSSFSWDTDNKNSLWGPSGKLRLNFYF